MERLQNQKNSEADALARKLASKSPDERASAQRRFDESDEAFKTLVKRGLEANALATKRILVRLAWLVFVLGLCQTLLAQWTGDGESAAKLVMIPFLPAFCAVVYLFLWHLPRQCGALFSALAVSGDAIMVGLLIDAITLPLKKDMQIWRQALERSIAQARPESPVIVTKEQLARLAGLLVAHWEAIGQKAQAYEARVILAITLVKTLAAVGGTPEMERLERLIEQTPKNDRRQRLHDYIVEVLPDWKTRLNREHQD